MPLLVCICMACRYMNSKNLVSLSAAEAAKMAKGGKAVIVDVRPREQYSKGHCQGAVSVPLYQSLDWSNGQVLGKVLKWVAYSFNGVT